MVALGIVEFPTRDIGLEAAGIVTRVGPEVNPDDIKVGDRVVLMNKPCFATYCVTPAKFCARIPDSLSFSDAATMLMPYVTSIYSLINIGRLQQGQVSSDMTTHHASHSVFLTRNAMQTVLVHSACGGVGLAAVQICQMLGADLFVTVGNDEKVQFLMDNFKIPRNRIFYSRDMSFVDGIMHETDGMGIDLILNSLAGELLHATWKCVAEFGTLVEIGKRDLAGDGKLDMRPFLANRSYCCVDVDLWKKPVLLTR